MPGKCKFQESWLAKDIYKEWLVKDGQDIHFARCRACSKSIKLQTMGEAALTSHAGGAGHKAAVRKLVEAGKLMLIKSDGQMNGSVNQADDTKDQVAICLQHDSSDRNPSSDWSDLHHSLVTNSTSHNVELQDMTYPTAFFTAPGTSRALSQRLHSSSSEAEDGGHHSARHDSMDLSRLKHQQRTEALDHQQQQMKIMEWENRMKVLAWEQELVREKRRAAQQKKKAFRMKKAYYKAKLKRMGEEVQLSSSSSSDEEEKTSDLTG
ncbi:uncharacterized protein LOC110961714 isoform X2 [Acanthochromis polyacanthus]|uniref:uncharacterized protein LOC110961714 isoform X2 n=1 Tax=Acanthochromis polyacanthus TaxID=80966 RepID=UPI000B8FD0D3|nr:uncharacterized protein LOC110961714 isoform X2 [Acanthochromis polyacanthus]